MFSKFSPLKSYRLRDNEEKCDRAGQSTGDGIIRRMCIVYKGYRRAHRMCNICGCFSATAVTRTRLNITFIGTVPVLFDGDLLVVDEVRACACVCGVRMFVCVCCLCLCVCCV